MSQPALAHASTPPPPLLSPRAAAALSALSPADADALDVALSESPPSVCIRAAIVAVIRVGVAQAAPDALPAFDATCDPLPSSPFAFVPLRVFLSRLAVAAHLCFPSLSLHDATNRLTYEQIHTLHSLPVFTPMLRACEGDWLTYFKLVPQSHSLTYSAGSSDAEVHSPLSASLHYEGVPSRASAYTTSGYIIGMLEAFSLRGQVAMDIHAPLRYSVTVTVTP